MPADRFIHPRMGHSDKVNLLTDLEFRVWIQYLLSADDFGVMRRSAVTLQAACDHLSNRPKKQIDRCLDALVKSGLLLAFEHQGRAYVCQWDWQTFQKVEYPRPTLEPKPTETVLLLCNEKTQELFAKHPGGTPKRAPKESQSPPENSEAVSQKNPDYARARPPETAKAKAYGLGSEGVQGKPLRVVAADDLADRARWLLEHYPVWFTEERNGARIPLLMGPLPFQDALALCTTWADDVRIEKLARLVLTTDDPYIAGTDRGWKIFVMKASWADDRLRQWETANQVAV